MSHTHLTARLLRTAPDESQREFFGVTSAPNVVPGPPRRPPRPPFLAGRRRRGPMPSTAPGRRGARSAGPSSRTAETLLAVPTSATRPSGPPSSALSHAIWRPSIPAPRHSSAPLHSPAPPTPRARPVGAQRPLHQWPIGRARGSRVDCDPQGAVGDAGAPRRTIPSDHQSDTGQTARQGLPSTENGAPGAGPPTQQPSTEHPAPSAGHRTPSAERRAPGTERRAPSTEHRAPSTKHRSPVTEQEDPNNADAVRRIVGDAMSTPDPRRPKLTRGTSAARATVRSTRPAIARSTRPSPRTTGCPTHPVTHAPRASGHPCPARSADSRTAGDVFPKPASRPGRSRPPAPSPPPSHGTRCSPPTVATCHAVPTGPRTPRTCRPASRHGPAEAQPHAASVVAGSDLSSCASEHTLATAAGSLTGARLADFGTTTRFRHRRRFVRTP